jgi:hypothetical protein
MRVVVPPANSRLPAIDRTLEPPTKEDIMRNNSSRIAIALVASASLVTVAGPARASGGGGDVVHRGSCSGATDWKLKVGRDDGRLEVEGEIDSNHAGQTWHWRIVHNGSTSASGTGRTRAPSGSFEVHRRLVNQAGTDKVTFRAHNRHSDERCVGTVRL